MKNFNGLKSNAGSKAVDNSDENPFWEHYQITFGQTIKSKTGHGYLTQKSAFKKLKAFEKDEICLFTCNVAQKPVVLKPYLSRL